MKQIIAQYIPIAEMIAQTMGNDCEVVLHDLEDNDHSVVYTVNNHVTGRMVGESFSQLVPEVMIDTNFGGVVANYYFNTSSGKLIKSSTALIKDFDQNVVGAMCLNIDATKIQQQLTWINQMLPGLEDSPCKSPKEVDKNTKITDIVDGLVEKIIGDRNVSDFSKKEKIHLIKTMEQKGVFLMKGSIEKVSTKTGIAKATIYSYMDYLKQK